MKWRLRSEMKRGISHDCFLRSLRAFHSRSRLRCGVGGASPGTVTAPWHRDSDSALPLQSHPQLPRGFLRERSRFFLDLLRGQSGPGAPTPHSGTVPAPVSPGGRWLCARSVTPRWPRSRGGSASTCPKAEEVRVRLVVPALCPRVPKSPRGSDPVPSGPGGPCPGCSPGGGSSGAPFPAPGAFPAQTFPGTNTSWFSSPQRTMRHCPARSAGNRAGNVSPERPEPPTSAGGAGMRLPKHPKAFLGKSFALGEAKLCGIKRLRILLESQRQGGVGGPGLRLAARKKTGIALFLLWLFIVRCEALIGAAGSAPGQSWERQE